MGEVTPDVDVCCICKEALRKDDVGPVSLSLSLRSKFIKDNPLMALSVKWNRPAGSKVCYACGALQTLDTIARYYEFMARTCEVNPATGDMYYSTTEPEQEICEK